MNTNAKHTCATMSSNASAASTWSATSAWSQALGVGAVIIALILPSRAQPPMGGSMGPRGMNGGMSSQGMSSQGTNTRNNQVRQTAQTQLSQAQVEWVRQAMTASGYADTTTQNAVLTFIQKQEQERQTLRQQERQMSTVLGSDQATDDQINAQLTAFRNAVVQSNARVTQALTALDQTIQYSAQPRLEMVLTVLGVVGQETSSLGGVGAVFPDSPFATTGRSQTAN